MIKVYEFVVSKDGEKIAEGSVLSEREAREVCSIHDRENGGGCNCEIKSATLELNVK